VHRPGERVEGLGRVQGYGEYLVLSRHQYTAILGIIVDQSRLADHPSEEYQCAGCRNRSYRHHSERPAPSTTGCSGPERTWSVLPTARYRSARSPWAVARFSAFTKPAMMLSWSAGSRRSEPGTSACGVKAAWTVQPSRFAGTALRSLQERLTTAPHPPFVGRRTTACHSVPTFRSTPSKVWHRGEMRHLPCDRLLGRPLSQRSIRVLSPHCCGEIIVTLQWSNPNSACALWWRILSVSDLGSPSREMYAKVSL